MITDLTIRNVRGVDTVELLHLERVNIVLGGNNQGKTSIEDAIRWLLVGRNQHTDQRGAGAELQIRSGAKKGKITANFVLGQGLVKTFERTIPSGTGSKAKKEDVEGFLGDINLIEACLSTRYMSELRGQELADLLAAFLLQPPPAEGLEPLLREHYGDAPADYFARNLAKAVAHDKGLEDWAETSRKAVRKEIEATDREIYAKRSALPSSTPAVVSADELQRRRQLLETASKDVTTEEARLKANVDSIKARREAWSAKKQQFEAARRELSAARTELAGVGQGPRTVSADQLADLRATLQAADARLAELRSEMDAATTRTVEANAGGTCPAGYCARVVHAEASAEFSRLVGEQRKAEVDRDTARTAVDQADRLERDAAAWAERQGRAQQRVDRAKEAEATARDPGTEPQDYESGARLASLRDQLRIAETQMRDGEKTAGDQARGTTLKAEIAKLEETMKHLVHAEQQLDALAKAFAPRGLRTRLLPAGIKDFAGDVDSLLFKHFGRHFKIEREAKTDRSGEQEPPWRCFATGADSHFYPCGSLLSWSERGRVSLCVQAVLAQYIDFSPIVVDELALDPTWRGPLLDLLLDLPVQSIVLSTAQGVAGDELVPPEAPEIDGVTWWWVENGKVRRLGQTEDEATQERRTA